MSLLERIGTWFGSTSKGSGQIVLGESPLVLIDIDVTGVDIRQDRVSGVALLPLAERGFRIDAIRYCALPPADTEHERKDAAACLGRLISSIGTAPVVCYNPAFVEYMLDQAARAAGLSLPQWTWFAFEDLLEGAFGKTMGEVPTLYTWLDRHGIAYVRQHSAISDVFAMAQLFEKLVALCAEADIHTLDALLDAHKSQNWLRGTS